MGFVIRRHNARTKEASIVSTPQKLDGENEGEVLIGVHIRAERDQDGLALPSTISHKPGRHKATSRDAIVFRQVG